MFFQLLSKAFKSCQDAPEMIDLQLGAPNAEVCVYFSNFCSKRSKVVRKHRKWSIYSWERPPQTFNQILL